MSAPERVSDPRGWAGRLSLWLDTNPPQVLNAGFELVGRPDAGELHLTSPLGQTVAQIEWRPGHAEFRAGERHERHASLADLTLALTGTPIPVQALFQWLQGQAVSADGWNADLSQRDAGRLEASRALPLPAARLRLAFESLPNAKPTP